MTMELWALVYVAMLQFALLHLHGQYTAFTAGILWGTGRRDDQRPVPTSPFGNRIERVIINNMESLAVFAPLVFIITLVGISNNLTILGSEMFLGARIGYAALYLGNIPYLRTLAWFISQIGLFLMFFVIVRI